MLYEIFVKATSLHSDEHKNYLAEIKQAHPELFDELLEMLKDDVSCKNMDTQFWSSLMAKESSSVINSAQDLTGLTISSFKLIELIDKGGMGSVYKAQRCDDQFEQTVAIKILHSELENIISEHALIREAGFMAKLTHSNIGKVFDAGISHDGYHFIVMEYIDGCTITQKFTESTLTLNKKLKIFCDLCDAVNHAHQMQVIHADLKPANILITRDNQVKILDFGIARMFNSRSTDTSAAYSSYLNAMTASFASPELLAGERPSMYSDIYALGKIFDCLFLSKKDEKLDYHNELYALVKKATSIIPSRRYASVLELKNDINRFLSDNVVSAYQASQFYRINKFIFKRHPISVSAGLIFIIIFSTLVTNLIIQYQELKNEKYQTDLMLEKFSLVLDLDLDAQSAMEMVLANNYASENKNRKALVLYKRIISRVNLLQSKDIAFDAGSKVIKLLIKIQQYELIESTLTKLKQELIFLPDVKIPATPSQAMFYHFYVSFTYHNNPNENKHLYKPQKKLVHDIKDIYWSTLSEQQKAELNFSTNRDEGYQELRKTKAALYYPEFKNNSKENRVIDYLFNDMIGENSRLKYLPKSQKVTTFLESSSVFWTSTHVNFFKDEETNQATFSEGITRFKEYSGIYQVDKNRLSMDYGEGAVSDYFIYASSLLALSVSVDGDLNIMTHSDFLHTNKTFLWEKKELLNNAWYHIYDGAINSSEEVKPSIVNISFKKSTAHFKQGSQAIEGQWEINNEHLFLKLPNSNERSIQLVKSLSDNHLVVVKDANSMLPSLLVKDKALAEFIIQYWRNLLE
jgi:serine/threonine-protein kinase